MPRRNQQNANGGDFAGRREEQLPECCTPNVCSVKTPIRSDNLAECIKVLCNNEGCKMGNYMHTACFVEWEQGLMMHLKNCGRARSWSDKQRQQNLWTKKGYDLVFRICLCKCGRGHLRKDLDWVQPRATFNQENDAKKKKKKNKQNALPVLGLGMPQQQNNHHGAGSPPKNAAVPVTVALPGAGAVAGATGVQEPPRPRTSSMSSTGSSSCSPGSGSTSGIDSPSSPSHGLRRKSTNEFFGDRARHGSGGSAFTRRTDFSSFNALPRYKVNSYQIKVDDDGNHDDIRQFILSTLGNAKINKVACCLCSAWMPVYDRCPLIDGTFFLSPRQHSKQCIEVRYEGRMEYLNSVCMGCLEGWGFPLNCRSCAKPWDGSHLVLGSMYAFDIFATVPCCADRLKCTNCNEPVLQPDQALQFFSDYSRRYECQRCKTFDFHFAKPLSVAFAPKKPASPQIAAIIQHSAKTAMLPPQAAMMAQQAAAAVAPQLPLPIPPPPSALMYSALSTAAPPMPPPPPFHPAPLLHDFMFQAHFALHQPPPPRRHFTGLLGDVQHHVSPLAIVAES